MPAISDPAVEFTEWASANSATLTRYALLLTANRAGADDLVQEALVRTYLRWASIEPGKANAFARRCMANLATDWWRRRRFESNAPLPERAGPDAYGPSDDRGHLVRALAVLTPRERAVVVLRHYTGLSEKETAAELGISVGTVKSTCSRALARLRELAEPSWSTS